MFKHLSRAVGGGAVLVPALIMLLALLLVPTRSQAAPTAAPAMPVAVPGYSVSVFASGGSANSHPDPIIFTNHHVYVAYQNVTAKDGTDHKSSTVVSYNASGAVDGTWSVLGHCDGLRVDPATGLLWATSNEDGNPGLVTINTSTNTVTPYQFPATPHGGGYDDLTFVDGKAFIAASNPTLDKDGVNTFPAIDQITLQNGQAQLTPVLMGNAPAVDMTSNATAPLNEIDPDSLTVDNQGNLVLVNQGGNEIVFIGHPGSAQQTVSRIPVGTQLDDTIWSKGGPGRLFITDGSKNTVYVLHTSQPDGTVFTSVPSDSGVAGFVGTVNISTGNVTPIAVGFGSPTGLIYVPDSQFGAGAAGGTVSSTAPVAVPGYSVSAYAKGGTANSHPDALIYANQHLYIAYQNITAKDGTDHKSSTVLAYNASGKVDGSWSVLGHCDGLRMDPATGLLWATSNEDGNPGLVTIDTASNKVTSYQFPATPHGGGYDDLAFTDGKAFIAASNPNLDKNGVNVFPAIDQITLQNGQAQLTPVLMGNAPAVDMTSNATAPLNEIDPDSLTVDNQGNLVLVNQGGNEIVFIGHPGSAQQTVSRIPVGTQLDDTIWSKGGPGRLFITDGSKNTVYVLHTSQPDGTVFTSVPSDSGVAGFVGTVNISTGNVTPIAIGFGSPTGLLYVPDSQPTTGPSDGSVPMLPSTGASNDAGWAALLVLALALLLVGLRVRQVGATR